MPKCIFKNGQVYVYEEASYRWLSFDEDDVQSSVDLQNQSHIVTPHCQYLLSALEFIEPKSTLMLGMGAGEMVRYLMAQTRCHISAVEANATIIELAKSFFFIPDDSERIEIFNQYAEDFIASTKQLYDCIFVDLYSPHKQQMVQQVDFIYLCDSRLSVEKGVLALNLCVHSNRDTARLIKSLTHQLKRLVLLLPIEGKNNIVLISPKQEELLENLVCDRFDQLTCIKSIGLIARNYQLS